MKKAFRIVIHGRVQGVGFRAFVERHGLELGLIGYVRNTAEGAVEVHAEGEAAILERFLQLIQKGPSLSKVDQVELEWLPASGFYQSFEIRY